MPLGSTPPVDGTLLRSRRPVLYGQAWLEDANVVYECTGFEQAGADVVPRRLVAEFASIKTPAHVAAFVGKYGPLGPVPQHLVDVGRLDQEAQFSVPVRFVEHVQKVLDEASALRQLLELDVEAGRASDGDVEAAKRLRELLAAEGFPERDDAWYWVRRHVAFVMTEKLAGVALVIDVEPSGALTVFQTAGDLRSYCYLHAARALARSEFSICRVCRQLFVQTRDDRQDCSKACGARLRQRTWLLKQKLAKQRDASLTPNLTPKRSGAAAQSGHRRMSRG